MMRFKIIALFLLFTGCSKHPEERQNQDSDVVDAPEAAFQTFQKTLQGKRWEESFDQLAPSFLERWKKEWNNMEERTRVLIQGLILATREEILEMTPREVYGKLLQTGSKNPSLEIIIWGKIENKTIKGDLCILDLEHNKKQRSLAVVREKGKWYVDLEKEKPSTQPIPVAYLKMMLTAEKDFRENDREGNGKNDYWVADVRGLYSLANGQGGGEINIIMRTNALADSEPSEKSPKMQGTKTKKSPLSGYWFVALKRYWHDGKLVNYDTGEGRNPNRFAFAAYPAELPNLGRLTYIITEKDIVWKKNTRGLPPLEVPENPEKEGWERLD